MCMKFIKGMIVGAMITTGVVMVCTDMEGHKSLLRKGRKFARKMGMM